MKGVMKIVFYAIMIISILSSLALITTPAYAATIHGTVYDLSLEPIDAFVEINTIPKQFYVAVNGDYEFNVNPGKYLLRANTSEGSAVEGISIIEDGNYTIDIVIGLDLEEPIEFIDDASITDVSSDIDNATNDSNANDYSPDYAANASTNSVLIGIAIIVVLALVIVILLVSRNKIKKFTNTKSEGKSENVKSENVKSNITVDDSDISGLAERVVAIVREHSRITQKELRKMLPYSEAKISLIIAELEHDGRIRKIKKGRGNILVYVK